MSGQPKGSGCNGAFTDGKRMKRGFVMARAAAFLSVFVIGLATWPPEIAACRCRRVILTQFTPPPLTPELARQALLDMLRTTKTTSPIVSDDPLVPAEILAKMAKMELHDGKDGSYYWSMFSIQPAKASYDMRIGPSNPEVKACTFFYQGTFQWVNGRWEASAPKLESSALGGGK